MKKIGFMKGALTAVAAAGVLLLAGCAGGKKGMVVAVSTLPDSLNPILEQNTTGLNINELLYDGLTNFNIDPDSKMLTAEYALAESMEQKKDRKTYRVELNPTAIWHDGTPFTAADVVYSFKCYANPANKSPNYEYLTSFISDVVEVDEHTVDVKFKKPIPEYNAMPVLTFKIIPSTYNGMEMSTELREGENERKFATAPVGTGPFKFASWEIGKEVAFTENAAYFGQAPKADYLTVKRIDDPVVRMNELRKGRVNLILETNPMDRPKVAKISDVDINSYMPYAFYQVAINTTSPSFSTVAARKAIAQALDKKNLVPTITDAEKGVVVNNGPYPSNLFAREVANYTKEAMPNNLKYNLKEAKKNAVASGLVDKEVILIYPDSMGDFGKALAEGIKTQLEEGIGVKVSVRAQGDQVYQRIVYKEKSFELALQYCEGFDNMYSSLPSLFRSGADLNVTGIADSQLDALFTKIDSTTDTEVWIPLIKQIDSRFCTVCPTIPLVTLQKDVYSRGLANVTIATDNPFISVESWQFK